MFCMILKQALSKTIVYKEYFNNYDSTIWKSYFNGCSSGLTHNSCGNFKILRVEECNNINYHNLIYNSFELQPHYQLTLNFKFLKRKTINDTVFIVYIDNQIVHEQKYYTEDDATKTCQISLFFNFFPISITLFHTSSSLTIALIAEKGVWGITEVELYIQECAIGCDSCNSLGCLNQNLLVQLFHQQIFNIVNQGDGWLIQECFGLNYIRYPNNNIFKEFDLDLHYAISFQLKLYIFHSQSLGIKIIIDNNLLSTTNYVQTQVKFQGSICNQNSIQEINLSQSYQHNSQKLRISIQIDQDVTLPTIIGIRDFKLFVKRLDDFCIDNNIVPFDGCFSNYYDCIIGCKNCIKGICWDCLDGWKYEIITKTCYPYCGDSIITYNEQCDDGNIIAYDGCHNCKYSCSKNCKICLFDKCIECEDQYLIIEGRCEKLQKEYKYSNQMEMFECFNLKEHKFQQVQQYITLQYLNQLNNIFDLSHFGFGEIGNQCQYNEAEQIINCKITKYGQCMECQSEYQLDFHKTQCIPKCQDGIILSEEVCDDDNRIQFDGCYKCQKSCQIECLLCFDNKCFNCQDGWHLEEYQCMQICGDGKVANLSNEQCDDLEDQYCANCKYQCENNCLVCDKFQNCEICQNPFKINDGKCLPICGDNIITPEFEQCDDGNDLRYDGCFQCQYECSFGCIQCQKENRCLLCEKQDYILDTQTFQCKKLQQQIMIPEIKEEINNNYLQTILCNPNYVLIQNQCFNLCGNGLLDNNFEQCDDGNNNGGDGCSALCLQEDSYDCINIENQQSICTFIQQPYFNLKLVTDKKNQTQTLELFFSQKVYISSDINFDEIVQFNIEPETQKQISIVPLNNLTSQIGNPIYQIIIQFLVPIENPILKVNIQKHSIFNQDDMELSNNYKEIRLGTPFVLLASNQKKTTQIIQINDIIIYSTVGISGLLFLTDNQIVFFNLLDLLQTLSYIRYMQYKFPPHLSQFLEVYTKISLKPILDSLKVDELIAKINGGSFPYLNKKSYQYNQNNAFNQFYLVNAKGCCIAYLISFSTYFVCYLICTNKVSKLLELFFRKYYYNMKVLRLIIKFQRKIQFKCFVLKKDYFSSGFFQLFYSSLHQLLFSTLIQFPDYTFNSLFEIFNSVVALGSLLFLINIFFRLLSITSSKIKNKQKWKYFFQDQKTEFWAANFKPFQIYRVVLFITIIVKFINYPEAQSILLSMQSLYYMIYLTLFRPIKSKFDQVKLICKEVILFITTGTFLIYTVELNDNEFLIYGWFHIGLLSFLMAFTLVVDIFEQIQKTYHLYLKNKFIEEKKVIQSYYNNSLQKMVANNLK